MNKIELGWTYPKRKKHIQDLLSAKTDKTHRVDFRGTSEYLCVYRAPISMPKYRLNNGRTYPDQEEYLSTHPDLPKGFFSDDPESDRAMEVQHDLLKKWINEKGLLDYFRTHEQTEPLILTNEGYVLNGNRRLCAMRELLHEDSEKYKHFFHIDVVLLPPAEEKDLDRLEAKLQIHRDIKADYTWYGFALMLRKRHEEHGHTYKELGQIYEKKEKEIKEYLDMLEYGEDYLRSRDREGEYHRLKDEFYAFQQLTKCRKKVKSAPKKELYDHLSFLLVKEPPAGGRNYEYIRDAQEHLDKIVDNITTELNIKANDNNYEAILEKLESDDNREISRDIIIDVVDGEKQKKKDKKRKNYVLTQVAKANTALIDATVGIKNDSQKNGIEEHLKSIEKSVSKLKEWLHGDSKN